MVLVVMALVEAVVLEAAEANVVVVVKAVAVKVQVVVANVVAHAVVIAKRIYMDLENRLKLIIGSVFFIGRCMICKCSEIDGEGQFEAKTRRKWSS